ncbi:MAG: lactonase family protein [Chitinophagaceae bacterium]|nr:lactonase family protein [Chitinophagaceae bacterium]
MKKTLVLFFLISPVYLFAQQVHYLLTGTYTSGKSEGIYVYKFNSGTGDHEFVGLVKSSNPSYLAVSPNKRFVYAVNENADSSLRPPGGSVTAYAFDSITGSLTTLNTMPSGGKHPCYIDLDKSGKHIAVANYTSGSIAVFTINEDGTLEEPFQLIQQTGSSVNQSRQASPHVHYTHFSSSLRQLFATDLGTDKILLYDIDPITKKLTPGKPPSANSVPGSGPRHMDFSKGHTFAYLLEELTGTVVVYKTKNKKLKFRQRISCFPADFKGVAGSADIHLSADGKFLYCSNRGDANNISIFSVHPKTGRLSLLNNQSTLGINPRNFNFDPSGNFLLVANQNSDEIVIFKIDRQTGSLSDSGKRIRVPNPVCIKWIH